MKIFYELLLQVFVFIGAGALAARLISVRSASSVGRLAAVPAMLEKIFVSTVYYFVVPLFIIFSLVQVAEPFSVIWRMALAVFFVLSCGGAAAGIFALASGRKFRDVALPVAVMNSAYLAIPVNTVLFGPAGAFWAVIYNVSVTIVHFTLGAMIVKGGRSDGAVSGLLPLDLPALWALAAGIIIRWLFADSAAAEFMRKIYPALAAAVLPTMLFFVGMKTARMNFSAGRLAVWGAPLRIMGGFLAGILAARIFALEGAAAAVCVMSSSMPSAVNTYILANKFGADDDFAASMVLASTVIGAVTIPLVAAFILR
jgi:hypothetical protein